MPRFATLVLILSGTVLANWGTCRGSEPDVLIQTIKAVGPQGEGNAAAQAAWRELVGHEPAVLPRVLESFDDANPLAANWLRSAVETIADRALQAGKQLPADDIERFALDIKRDAQARRLAYEWLLKVDASAEDRLIPGMLHDPSPEFRRDAVQRLVAQAEQLVKDKKKDEARDVYREALSGATEADLVKSITGALKKLGERVDIPRHFGFVTAWTVVGPFDNRDQRGFDAVYPPEEEAEPAASYEGQLGTVTWKSLETAHEYGIFDIGKLLENYKGSAMYCRAEFVSDVERPVEFRLGTPNSWKVWLNGEFLFGREEYHRGMAIDQYRVKATLKPGPNVILLKICQDEQPHDWAQRYQFQFRVCDSGGRAVHAANTDTQED